MKYSTAAVVVACIGGAALAAAETPVHHHHAPTPGKTSRLSRTANRVGKTTQVLGKFAQHATGNGYTAPETLDNAQTNQATFTRRTLPSRKRRPGSAQLKHAAQKTKEATGTLVNAAGGSQELAGNVGNVVNLVQTYKQQNTDVVRRDGETKKPARRRKGKKQRLAPQSQDEVTATPEIPTVNMRDLTDEDDLSLRGFDDATEFDARAFDEEDELFARGKFSNFVSKVKSGYHERKGKDFAKEAAKEAAIAGAISTPPSEATYPPRQFDEELDLREFDDELDLREFDDELDLRDLYDEDELFARGKFSNFVSKVKSGYHERKGKDFAKEAAKEAAIAGAISTPPSEATYPPREFDEELDLREFEDELEARKFLSHLRNGAGALKDAFKGKTSVPPLTTGLESIAPPTEATLPGRSFDDEEALTLRDLYDLADELDARAFDEEDELFARGILSKFVDKVKAGYHSRKGKDFAKEAAKENAIAAAISAPPTDATYPPREFDEELDLREFDDELDLREFEDELEARKFLSHLRNGAGALKDAFKGKTSAPPLTTGLESIAPPTEATLPGRSFDDEESLSLRDLYDFASDLEGRADLEGDLEVRGLWSKIKNGVGAVKDAIFKKKTAPVPTMDAYSDPNAAAVVRDVFDGEEELGLRDFFDGEEDLALRDLSFDEEMELFERDVPEEFEARDIFEDELDARDFEIDELD